MEAVHLKLCNYKYRVPTSAHYLYLTLQNRPIDKLINYQLLNKILQVLWNLKVHDHTTFSEPMNLQHTLKPCF